MVNARRVLSPSLGVAISDTTIVVCEAERGELSRTHVAVTHEGDWTSVRAPLRDALRDALRARATHASGSSPSSVVHVRVALLSPLAEVREVSLPPVNDGDAKRLLSLSASRHFLQARAPLAIGVASAERRPSPESLATRIAAAVPVALLDTVNSVATEAGCVVDYVVPALAAWVSGLPAAARAVLVRHEGFIELAAVRDSIPRSLRRFRVVGDDAAIADALAAADASAAGAVQRVTDPVAAAAMAMSQMGSAPGSHGPPLVFTVAETSDSVRTAHSGSARLIGVAAALLLLLLTSVGALEWQARRSIARVRAERATLAPALTAAAPRRTLREQSRLLVLREQKTIRWLSVMTAIGGALPADAWLTRLQYRGDTLVLEGRAANAARAFAALAASPVLAGGRASAPVRRESSAAGEAVDLFEFSVPLGDGPGAPPPPQAKVGKLAKSVLP